MAVTMGVQAADTSPWLPPVKRQAALTRDLANVLLTFQETTVAQAFTEPEWVYLSCVIYAEQVHPWTVDQVAALGGIESDNAKRWTLEGPIMIRPGEPNNCILFMEIAHSLAATPGNDWRAFRPGLYKLRSYKFRFTVVRPDTTFDFRIYRLGTRVTKRAPPRRRVIEDRFFHHG